MNRKADTLNLVSMNGFETVLGPNTIRTVALGLLAVALVVTAAIAVTTLSGPNGLTGNVAGLEASSARWVAMGEQFAPNYEASAAASSARYSAMAADLGLAFSDASTARWVALGEQFAPNYEASAAASSARYSAMAADLGLAFSDASTARWVALGEQFAPNYEASAAASSARWAALGERWATAVVASAH